MLPINPKNPRVLFVGEVFAENSLQKPIFCKSFPQYKIHYYLDSGIRKRGYWSPKGLRNTAKADGDHSFSPPLQVYIGAV